MTKWRIKRGEKIAGEVPSSKVRQLAAAGKLRTTDLLCKEGTDKWVVAGSVKGLWPTPPTSQTSPGLAQDQNKPNPVASSAPTSATNAAVTAPAKAPTANVTEEVPPQEESKETVAPQTAQDVPQQPEIAEAIPQEQASAAESPQQESVEKVHQQESADASYEQEEIAAIDQIAEEEEDEEEPENVDIQPPQEADEEDAPEPEEEYDLEPEEDDSRPQRKWLMPVIFGGIGCFLLLGLLSLFMGGEAPNDRQSPMRTQQSIAGQQKQPSEQYNTNSNLSLAQNFFPPNIARNFEYSTKKFENNTTVAVYRKSIVEKWNTETELYFHEKGFRNYGQKVPYRISDGYVQLKGKENWFRFLKLNAKAGDSWTPGDGEDGTLDWTGKGELKLLGFKTVDSVDVAVVEFTAKPELSVPSYLVPAGFDFGIMEDGGGPIEGKVRFELGDGLGLLRADSIVPKGARHRTGGGRDNSEWIFATRLRNSDPKNEDVVK